MTRGVIAALGAVLLLAACGSGGGGSSSNPISPPTPVDLRGRTHVEVDAKDNFFTPASIVVDEGTTVMFKNEGTVDHNVHQSADAVDFGARFGIDTADFGPGTTYSFAFDKLGTFTYTCTIHSLMNGQVQVVAKSSPASSTSTTTA